MKKKIFATLLAAVMTIASTVTAFAADEMSYTAGLSFMEADYGYQDWGETDASKTTITGEGTYTLTVSVSDAITGKTDLPADSGAGVFVIDIGVADGNAATDLSTYELEELVIKVDGVALDVDLSKVLTGDLEGNGRYRIEVFNCWGNIKTADACAVDPSAVKFNDKLEVSFTLNDPSNDTPAGGNDGGNDGGNNDGGNNAGGNTAGGNTAGGTDTADVAPVAALVALAAVAAAVVLKKRTVNE